MPRKTVVVQLHIHVAWWLPCYLVIVRTLCEMLGRESDVDRVQRRVRRGVRIVAMPAGRVAA